MTLRLVQGDDGSFTEREFAELSDSLTDAIDVLTSTRELLQRHRYTPLPIGTRVSMISIGRALDYVSDEVTRAISNSPTLAAEVLADVEIKQA